MEFHLEPLTRFKEDNEDEIEHVSNTRGNNFSPFSFYSSHSRSTGSLTGPLSERPIP